MMLLRLTAHVHVSYLTGNMQTLVTSLRN